MKFLLAPLVPAGLAAVFAGVSAAIVPRPVPADPGVQEAPAALVQIALDSAGAIVVSPDPVVVTPGERVEWTGQAGSWSIHIPMPDAAPGERPFAPAVHQRGVHGGAGDRVGAVVQARARPGSYKYIVSVFDGSRVLVLDPELVIGPG